MDIDKQVEVSVEKIRPGKGDVVIIKIKSDDVDYATVQRIREQFNKQIADSGASGIVYSVGPDDDVEHIVIGADEWKKLGRCPQCGSKGEWKALALVCPVHGVFAG